MKDQEETWETMEYCRTCRDYHEVNEELGSWLCPHKGASGEDEAPKKLLDRIMQDPTLQQYLNLGGNK